MGLYSKWWDWIRPINKYYALCLLRIDDSRHGCWALICTYQGLWIFLSPWGPKIIYPQAFLSLSLVKKWLYTCNIVMDLKGVSLESHCTRLRDMHCRKGHDPCYYNILWQLWLHNCTRALFVLRVMRCKMQFITSFTGHKDKWIL